MSLLDWVVLFGTLSAIVAYGVWKTRHPRDMADYLHGGYADRWPTIGLSVMATQASAITFLSTPGQAYTDGMRFLQFYFGLPLAMVVLSIVVRAALLRAARLHGVRVPRGALRSQDPPAGGVSLSGAARAVGRHHDLRAGDRALDGAGLVAAT